jgi:hypothetical protein
MRDVHKTTAEFLLGVLVLGCSAQAQVSTGIDSDHDGLSDELEQGILEKFRPTFMISEDDCDLAPAAFKPGVQTPTPLASDGTIYGQVSPAILGKSAAIEVHYYHLWKHDCGRIGHPLDAEHVAVLLANRTDPSEAAQWKAQYWYAAAHEDTVCDASSAARAEDLGAVEKGAQIWISDGKHASFLQQGQCRRGCGADRCDRMRPLDPRALINIGELRAPMNGSDWITSRQWPLAAKLGSDFRPEIVDRLAAREARDPMPAGAAGAPLRSTIGAGDASVEGLGLGYRQAGSAIGTGARKALKSLGAAYLATQDALQKASE